MDLNSAAILTIHHGCVRETAPCRHCPRFKECKLSLLKTTMFGWDGPEPNEYYVRVSRAITESLARVKNLKGGLA